MNIYEARRLVAERIEQSMPKRELTHEEAEQPSSTAGGDSRKLRGIPAIGLGVSGHITGTDPLQALLDKEEEAA